MKKLLCVSVLFLLTQTFGFAADITAPGKDKTPVNFIYIHGSDEAEYTVFEKSVSKMHSAMKKNLEKNKTVQKLLLKGGVNYINPDFEIQYWADKAKEYRLPIDKGLSISKIISPTFAQFTRTLMSHIIHDAVWIKKERHMAPIIDELNEKIKANAAKGEKTVLVGYSAGTFVTYEYMLNRLRLLNLYEIFTDKTLNITDRDRQYFKALNIQPTCTAALFKSKTAILTLEDIIPNPNRDDFISGLKSLNKITECTCAPSDGIEGVINFASPIVIFYSEVSDENAKLTKTSKQIMRYLVENGKFWLTVNNSEDPLAITLVPNEFNISVLKDNVPDIKPDNGFIFDTYTKSGKSFIKAHLIYWNQAEKFTKAVASNFEKGYKNFYCTNKNKKQH